MPDFICLNNLVVIVFRMILEIIVHLVLKLLFQFQIRFFCCADIFFRCRIAANSDGFNDGLSQRGKGLQTADEDQ